MKFALIAALVLGSGAVASYQHSNTEVGTSAPRQDDDDINQKARQAFMRGKLVSNQAIVEGLSTKNYELIQQGATAVTALVKGQHWFVVDTPEYKTLSAEMETAAKRLGKAAEEKNIEAAALRYFELTLNCIDCHEYISTTKY